MLTLIALQTAALAAPAPLAESSRLAAMTTAALTTAAAPSDASIASPGNSSAVSIQTKDEIFLKGSFFAPKAKKKKNPAALLLHDEGHSREELATFAAYLQKRGFAVMTVDLRGHGDSATEETDYESADDKARENLWNLAGRDVEAAAEYLGEQEGVHPTNLSIIGFGSAASLAVRRATTDENVRAVVLVDPETETYDYDVTEGVADLGGLPTMVVTTKAGRKVADSIRDGAHEANGGLEYVDVTVLKCEPEEIPGFKKMFGRASGWMRDQALPKKKK